MGIHRDGAATDERLTYWIRFGVFLRAGGLARIRTDARLEITDGSDPHSILLAPPASVAKPQRMSAIVKGTLRPVRVDVSIVEVLLRVLDTRASAKAAAAAKEAFEKQHDTIAYVAPK